MYRFSRRGVMRYSGLCLLALLLIVALIMKIKEMEAASVATRAPSGYGTGSEDS